MTSATITTSSSAKHTSFRSALVNDLRFSATRQNLVFQHPSFDQGLPAQLGFPPIIPQDAFPPIVIDGILAFGSGARRFCGRLSQTSHDPALRQFDVDHEAVM